MCNARIRHGLVRWRFVLCAVVLGACGGADGDGGSGATAGAGGTSGGGGYAVSVHPIFERSCNCHQSSPLMAPFSLQAMEAHDNLVGVPSSELPSMDLVTPGDLDKSYLWHKLEGTQLDVGGTGSQMPVARRLDESERDIIVRWIMDGAAP